ncbi:hypothetical protein TB1_039714 [Malus domestica]
MYTFSWGNDGKLDHLTEPTDVEPHPLMGALENVPVVKIAAGYCYATFLLWLVNQMAYGNRHANVLAPELPSDIVEASE